jgi:replicative DNA helicase
VLDQVGGLSYLGSLARDTPTAANIRAYADIVRERSVLRQLITAGNLIVGSALEPEGREAREIVDEAERAVFEIAEAVRAARSDSGRQEHPAGSRQPHRRAVSLRRQDDRSSRPASSSSMK